MKGAVKAAGAVSLCPIPHTLREKFWLVAGVALGAAVGCALALRLARASTASSGVAPRVLPSPARVVDVPNTLAIDEC